jgi:phasin family protein
MTSFQAAGNFPFTRSTYSKPASYFSWASLNVATLLEIYQRNMAALANANQVAFDGLTTLMQRQATLFNATIEDCSRGMNDVLAAASMEAKASRQADTARHSYESAAARFRELYEIAAKAHADAADILSARLTEALGELKVLFAAPLAETEAPAAEQSPALIETTATVVEPPEPAPAPTTEASVIEAAPAETAPAETVHEIASPAEPASAVDEPGPGSAELAASPEEPVEDDEPETSTTARRTAKPRSPRTPGGSGRRPQR